MAQRAVKISLNLPGRALAVVIALLLGGAGLALALQSGRPVLSSADWSAVRFSLTQAVLSALLSVALALPVARALARRRFAGRGLLIAAMGAPFLLPVLVAALGLLGVFGRNGLLNQGLAALGLPGVQIYGLSGVLLGHVFLNMPLAVRMLLHGWQAIPQEQVRLAESLGLGPRALFRHLELPMLRQVVPGALLAVFLVCLSSFALVLILGGGPKATTLELAIYQAVRFDFDLPRAAALALVQFGLCALAVLLAGGQARMPLGGGLDRTQRLPQSGGWRRGADGLALVLAAAFLAAPLSVVVLRGLPGLFSLPGVVWQAALTSVLMALAAAVLCGLCLLALTPAAVAGRRGVELAAMAPMATSSLALGAGLFLILNPFVAPSSLSLPITVLVNVLMSLPFGLRLLMPAWAAAEAGQGRLADSLGMRGMARLRFALMPRLRRPFGMALGVAAALSMGDLGVITLFASDLSLTLPLQVWSLMGAYRSAQAEAAALLLVILSFGLFALFDFWGRRNAAA